MYNKHFLFFFAWHVNVTSEKYDCLWKQDQENKQQEKNVKQRNLKQKLRSACKITGN